MEIKHIGIVLDGNRRFAKRLMLKPWKGHELGYEKVEKLFDWCKELGIKELTLYTFSIENSYVFISPLRAKADNQEKIRLTVFVLNDQGLGVQGKKVTINTANQLNIEVIQGLTDGVGKAVFDITSANVGQFYLKVLIEDKALLQEPQLSFY